MVLQKELLLDGERGEMPFDFYEIYEYFFKLNDRFY